METRAGEKSQAFKSVFRNRETNFGATEVKNRFWILLPPPNKQRLDGLRILSPLGDLQNAHIHAGFTLRHLPLRDGTRQIAEQIFHVHKPLSKEMFDQTEYAYLEVEDRTYQMISNLSQNLVQTEYVVSDLCGTLIQTEPSGHPLGLFSRPDSYCTFKNVPHRQAEPYEAVQMNSYSFHAAGAAKPKEWGDDRGFLISIYGSPKSLEEHVQHLEA